MRWWGRAGAVIETDGRAVGGAETGRRAAAKQRPG
jgi:hypothetical protein